MKPTMDQNLVDFLNNFGAGTSIAGIVLIGSFIYMIYKKIKGFKNNYDNTHRQKVLEDEHQKQESENVEKIIGKVSELETKIDDQNKDLKNYVDEKYEVLENRINANDNVVSDLNKSVLATNNALSQISESLLKIDKSIDVLLDSDCETIRSFIMSEYCKWVEDKGEIDLITLQNIERMYKKYLEEVGENTDEFIDKLVNEIRQLPTKK